MPLFGSALGIAKEHLANGMTNGSISEELNAPEDVGSNRTRLANGIRIDPLGRTMSGASRSESGNRSVSRSFSRRKSGCRIVNEVQRGHYN